MRKLSVWCMAVFLAASLASCGEKREVSQKQAVDDQTKVLATVNGVPITENDMKQRVKGLGMGGGDYHEVPPNVLQTLVRDELIYQKSVQLGLDKDPEYRLKLNDMEAQLRAFQKKEMSSRFSRYVQGKTEVTDSEAREYFEKNAKMMQTKFHVLQIFYRGKYAEIEKDHRDVKSGMPFEKVAARRFPDLPKNMKAPWDLGEMAWNQLPPPWQGIVDRLEPGQVTDIIKGPNDRYWVIKLAGKKVDTGVTFAAEKERIVQLLRQQKADVLYKSMLDEMKEKAKIIYPAK